MTQKIPGNQPSLPSSLLDMLPRERQCGECTCCCDGWLKVNVFGRPVDTEHPCPFNSGHSCTIYEQRPVSPCREFICGWMQPENPLPEWFRPDQCGVITLFSKLEWLGHPVDALVPTGKNPDEKVLSWMQNFANTHQRPFVYLVDGEWCGYGPPDFKDWIKEKIAKEGGL